MPRFLTLRPAVRPAVRLAVRFLTGAPGSWRGRGRLAGAIIAVAVSLVPLVVVQQVADGMIRGIVERFIETGSYHLQAASRTGVPDADVLNELRLIPGVNLVVPERQGFGLVYSDHGRSGVTLRSVPPEYWSGDPRVRDYLDVTAGAFDLTREDTIILGIEIASRLRVTAGDEVRVLTVRPLGEGRMLPRVSRFIVGGVVSTGYRDLDRLWSFVPWERGVRIIPDETARDILGIKVDAPFSLENPLFQRGLGGVLPDRERQRMSGTVERVRHALGPEWVVYNWYGAERNRYVSFLTSRNLLAFVMALIVAVAVVNISSALVLLVLEKEDDIAILRATGASRGQIARAFVLCGALIGVAGATLGAMIGTLLAININEVLAGVEVLSGMFAGREIRFFTEDFYLEQVPVEIAFTPLFLAVLLALSLALAAALVPARRAAAIPPDHILRRHG